MACCLLVLVGCRGAQYVGTSAAPGGGGEGLFAPQAPTRNQRFENATSSLREQVQLLGSAPGTVDEASTRRAVHSLADAIANVPDPQGVDVDAAAGSIRSSYVNVAGAMGPNASRRLRESLMVAAGAMTLLARGPYAREPAVARRVAAFEHAAASVSPDEAIEGQAPAVIHALAGAGAALASLDRASVIAPASSTGVTAEQPPSTTPGVAPFASALVAYSDAVDALAVTPPGQVPDAVQHALNALAGVLQVLPAGAPAGNTGDLALMRSLTSDIAAAPAQSAAQARLAKLALDRAGAILSLAARQGFQRVPAVGDEVRLMRIQVGGVDSQRPLEPQLSRILASLEAAEDVLRTIARPPQR